MGLKVKMAGKLDSRAYTFDQVYDSSASQNDVYMGAGDGLVTAVFELTMVIVGLP